jgi:hypothetical protein
VAFSFFAYWYLPRSASEAKFLNEDEKKLAYHRMAVDSSSVVNEPFNLKDGFAIFKFPSRYATNNPFPFELLRERRH